MPSVIRAHGPSESKRFASFGVALCVALAGTGLVLIVVRDHKDRVSDVALVSESQEQRELREGWRELGALAASFPPVTPHNATPAVAPPRTAVADSTQPLAPASDDNSASNGATQAAAGGGFGGADNGGSSGSGTGGGGGMPVAASALPAAAGAGLAPPDSQSLPAPSSAPAVPAALGLYQESALCGPSTCNVGQVCCNASCGTCTAPGASCDQTRCEDAIQYPASQACGMTTCNVGSVCCNASCGICTAPGAECSQRACG